MHVEIVVQIINEKSSFRPKLQKFRQTTSNDDWLAAKPAAKPKLQICTKNSLELGSWIVKQEVF